MFSYEQKADVIFSSSLRLTLESIGLDAQDPNHSKEHISTSTFEINYVLGRLTETDLKKVVQIDFWRSALCLQIL